MLTIEKLNQVYYRVYGDEAIEKELGEYFTFSIPNSAYMKKKRWNGKIKLYNSIKKTLYIGLYQHLIKFLKDRKYEYTLDDPFLKENISKEEFSDFISSLKFPKKFRDYQLTTIFDAITNKRRLFISPTSSGKSACIYAVLQWLFKKNQRTLIIVPSINLVLQMINDFKEYAQNIEIDITNSIHQIHSGNSFKTDKLISISCWQSIYKLPREYFNQFNCIIGDEAHGFYAKSLQTLMEKSTDVEYKLGFTGTLQDTRCHKLVLQGLFGPTKVVTTTKKLIEKGQVTNLKINIIQLNYNEECKKICKKFTYREEVDFVNSNESRNKFIRNLAINLDGNTLILFRFIENHGKIIFDYLQQKPNNKKIYFAHGKIDAEERENIRNIVSNENDCIVVGSMGTFSTGINIPSIHNVIFASPNKSKIKVLQSIGRGLRLHTDKSVCNIYDIVDNLTYGKQNNHLIKHCNERIQIYNKEEFEYSVINVQL